MTTVVISQPMYFPWIGFIGHMSLADHFIWLDDAQFSKGSYTNRIQVKTARDRTWMTIPLAGKGAFQEIRALKPDADSWRTGHRDLLRQQLKGRPHLAEALAVFDRSVAEERLIDALIASSEQPAAFLGVLPPAISRSSTMSVDGTSSERVLALVKAVGGTRYITGHGAANYLDHEMLERAGVDVAYMAYDIPAWAQPHGTFTPFVTVLDPIASIGRDARNHLPGAVVDWRTFLSSRRS